MTKFDKSKPHPRNQLNQLTGREWLYATRSVILSGTPAEPLNDLSPEEWSAWAAPVLTTSFPTRGPASAAHAIRRAHPSPKPPQLMAEVIQFFSQPHGWVLDPFAGVGGTLLGCALTERNGIGIELSADYIDIYQQAAAELELPTLPLLHGDARTCLQHPEITSRTFDAVITDPPYASMLSRERTGERRKRGNGAATPFTNNPADLGNLELGDFLDALRAILALAIQPLRVGGHLVVFVKDLQPTPEHHNMLHADVVNSLMQLPNLRYRGYRIWYDQSALLYPFGYPYAFVANQVHQFILVFQKQAEDV